MCNVIFTASPWRTTSTGPGAVAVPSASLLEKPQIGTVVVPSSVVVPVMAYRSHELVPSPGAAQLAGANRPAGAAASARTTGEWLPLRTGATGAAFAFTARPP